MPVLRCGRRRASLSAPLAVLELSEIVGRRPRLSRSLLCRPCLDWVRKSTGATPVVEPGESGDLGPIARPRRSPRPAPALCGGLSGPLGPRLADLVGLFPDSVPIRVRRSPENGRA